MNYKTFIIREIKSMKRSIILFIILSLSCSFLYLKQNENSGNILNVHFKFYFNEILFSASINHSRPLWFILDTGASDLIINEKTVAELDLPLGDIVDQGFTGIGEERVYETCIKEVDLKINDAENHFVEGVFAGKLDLIETVMGHRIDGVVGRHLFKKFVIELDYQNKIFNMYNPNNYQFKDNGKQIPIFVQDVPYAKATVILPNNQSIEGTFMIDNGSSGEISFTTQFCLEHNLPGQMKNSVPSIQTGGGGNSGNKVGRINALIFGGYKIESPIAAISKDSKGGMGRKDIAGLIGSGILKHFKVIFDYERNRMILNPYDSVFESMEWDMSGMFLYAKGNNFDQIYIYDVIPGSPADEAGIKGGDQIISIDGINARSYSIDDITKMFKLNGKQYNIGLLRNNKNIEVKIKLHKMI